MIVTLSWRTVIIALICALIWGLWPADPNNLLPSLFRDFALVIIGGLTWEENK